MHSQLGKQRAHGPLHDDVDAAAPHDSPADHYDGAADNHDQQAVYDHHDRQ
ncbi:MAG TPA: hypothetical protein VFB94_17645 [Acidimicrobiales bacterium]|jgi:hypothetical protein|nr:hypothetical protein [Acidimicrobiales bacterium]